MLEKNTKSARTSAKTFIRSALCLLALVAVVGSGPVAAQGLTVRRVMTPRLPAGMGALAGALRGIGGDVPTEIAETFFVSADGTLMRVERVDETVIYDLNGAGRVITIDEREMTWEQKTFAEYQEPFRQLTDGGAPGRDREAPAGAPESPDFEDIAASIDIRMEAQDETEVNGYQSLLAHQVVSFDMSSQGQAQSPLGMDGTMHAASKVWFVDRRDFDLMPLNHFYQQLAERLFGVPLGGAGQDMTSWMNDPRARELIEEFQTQTEQYQNMEALPTPRSSWSPAVRSWTERRRLPIAMPVRTIRQTRTAAMGAGCSAPSGVWARWLVRGIRPPLGQVPGQPARPSSVVHISSTMATNPVHPMPGCSCHPDHPTERSLSSGASLKSLDTIPGARRPAGKAWRLRILGIFEGDATPAAGMPAPELSSDLRDSLLEGRSELDLGHVSVGSQFRLGRRSDLVDRHAGRTFDEVKTIRLHLHHTQ